MAGYELHVISDGKHSWSTMTAIALEIQSYVTAIHIREKTKPMKEVLRGLQTLLEAGVSPKRIYINGYPSLAIAAKLGGAHLPGSSPPLAAIREICLGYIRTGISIHSAEEAWLREQEGADYLMFGHIFATDSKQGLPPRGIEQLREVTGKVKVPVIAIGGISPGRVRTVLEAGASGIAVMSGIWEAQDPQQAAKAYADEMRRYGG